jgi:hypothetical protein
LLCFHFLSPEPATKNYLSSSFNVSEKKAQWLAVAFCTENAAVRIGSQVVFTKKQYYNTTLCKHDQIKNFLANASLSRIKRSMTKTIGLKSDARASALHAGNRTRIAKKIGGNQRKNGKANKQYRLCQTAEVVWTGIATVTQGGQVLVPTRAARKRVDAGGASRSRCR